MTGSEQSRERIVDRLPLVGRDSDNDGLPRLTLDFLRTVDVSFTYNLEHLYGVEPVVANKKPSAILQNSVTLQT